MKAIVAWRWLAGIIALPIEIVLQIAPLLPDFSVQAQIIPDATLPVNSSVTSGCTTCEINGGTVRGVNLFHSFREFSIPTGGSAWFNNAPQIQTILTRVTGNTLSNIDGLIKANGTASLFLLNPNGIILGQNARLQIGGSFVASTANSFKFPDGSEFSTTDPQAPPLLTVNLTPGLQSGSIASGTITNRGNLTAEQDLILEATHLDLQGQLVAGRDLILKSDTVQIRDVTTPFAAQSGRDLLIQGDRTVDIFALNHSASGLFSGRNLVIRSATAIIGDAHYTAGGNVRVEQLDGQPGILHSPHDPIIRSNGDVVLGGYVGASLHIFAGGSVTITGLVDITGADPVNGIVEAIALSNGATVNINGQTTPTLDIRAGLDPIAIGAPIGLTGAGAFTAPAFFTPNPTNADISVGTIFTPADVEGLVFLTNQYRPNLALPGTIQVGDIDASILVGAANGSSVVIDSRGAISGTGVINSSAPIGNGGNITMLAQGDLTLFPGAEITSQGTLGGVVNLSSQANLALLAADIFNNSSGNLPGATGGSITLTGQSVLLDFAFVESNTLGQVNSGQVRINATNAVQVTNDSSVRSLIFGGAVGNSGGIAINAGSVVVNGNSELNSSVAGGQGRAGDIAIAARDGVLFEGGFARSRLEFGGVGRGGDIQIDAGSVTVTGVPPAIANASIGQLVTATFADGDAGSVRINARGAVVFDGRGSDIFTLVGFQNPVGGNAGDIVINSGSLLVTNQARLISQAEQRGNGGRIAIATGTLSVLNGSVLSSFAQVQGNAGGIRIQARDAVTLSSGVATSAVAGIGNAADISIQAGSLSLDQFTISASTAAQGNAGGVTIQVDNDVSLANKSEISTSVQPNAIGNAGTIDLTARSLNLTHDSRLSASTDGQGNAGNITVNVNTLNASQGGQLRTTTSSNGRAGDITVGSPTRPANQITLAGINSGLFANTSAGSGGQGGSIALVTHALTVIDNARISASTGGQGNTGTIQVQAGEVSLTNNARIEGRVEVGAMGSGQEITLKAGTLSLAGSAQISASTAGQGNAGRIVIQTSDRISLGEGAQIQGIAEAGSTGNGRSIDLETREFNLTGGAQVTARTDGLGNAGNINLIAATVDIADPGSGLLTQTNSNTGRGGAIAVSSQDFRLSNGAALNATTTTASPGGSITVNTNRLDANSGGQLLTTTSGSGRAGDITVSASDLMLSDRNTGLFASTIAGSTGNGGNIFVNAGTTLIENQAGIAAGSQGTGQGGSIAIQAGQLTLNQQAFITAETATNQGGNITIESDRLLLLRRDSLISASAGTTQAGGDGGNITIRAPFIIGVLGENSDITANAFSGNGGKINITTNAIYGLRFQPKLTPFSDITASSQLGISGTVTINTLNIDPSRGLAAFSVNLVDPSNQIAVGCSVGRQAAKKESRFVVTGRGGLPESPNEAFGGDRPLVELAEIQTTKPESVRLPGDLPNPSSPLLITEAQGWAIAPNGKVALLAKGVISVPHGDWQTPHHCWEKAERE
ncbi:filamentous hemagglutinin N-terminal domain-containing protein [Leptolyngbyaceae cyanobacterium UHCC 1019]